MNTLYLITGAAGHLGSTLARQLVADGRAVRGFDLPGATMIDGVEKFYGDVTQPIALTEFMRRPSLKTKIVVIHCAGLVSIASHFDPRVQKVNVGGTKNVLGAAIDARADKFIYISSVHAIPELPDGKTMTEIKNFDPDKVVGLYAKTKAEASAYVMETATKAKLNFNILHPSGIAGPYDDGHGHISAMILDFYRHRLTSGVKGGYDFVDVRDVADGVISACDKGKSGECYILSNRYFSVKEILDMTAKIMGRKPLHSYLPLWFVKLTAPFSEFYYRLRKVPPLYTAYSIYTLKSNANFSHTKADRNLGYKTRDMSKTLRDTIEWFKEIKLIK